VTAWLATALRAGTPRLPTRPGRARLPVLSRPRRAWLAVARGFMAAMPPVSVRVRAGLAVLSRPGWAWLAVARRIRTTAWPVCFRAGAPRRLPIGIRPGGLGIAARGQAGWL
jgi:hypothetical protein